MEKNQAKGGKDKDLAKAIDSAKPESRQQGKTATANGFTVSIE
jgi:hypothetical protein